MELDDPLGRRALQRRLLTAIAVAAVAGVVAWNVLESGLVQRWIWSHEDWGRLEGLLDIAGAFFVPVAYFATFALLGRRADRRWHAEHALPPMRARSRHCG
jgi:hypothetical protein